MLIFITIGAFGYIIKEGLNETANQILMNYSYDQTYNRIAFLIRNCITCVNSLFYIIFWLLILIINKSKLAKKIGLMLICILWITEYLITLLVTLLQNNIFDIINNGYYGVLVIVTILYILIKYFRKSNIIANEEIAYQ